jgi:hypothetical protein
MTRPSSADIWLRAMSRPRCTRSTVHDIHLMKRRRAGAPTSKVAALSRSLGEDLADHAAGCLADGEVWFQCGCVMGSGAGSASGAGSRLLIRVCRRCSRRRRSSASVTRRTCPMVIMIAPQRRKRRAAAINDRQGPRQPRAARGARAAGGPLLPAALPVRSGRRGSGRQGLPYAVAQRREAPTRWRGGSQDAPPAALDLPRLAGVHSHTWTSLVGRPVALVVPVVSQPGRRVDQCPAPGFLL